MFGFFGKKKAQQDRPISPGRSWHYSESEGMMVPCDTTPCRKHGNNDIFASSFEAATKAHENQVASWQRRKYEESLEQDGMGLQVVNYARTHDNVPDPLTMSDGNYSGYPLFRQKSNNSVISLNPIKMGDYTYALSANINDISKHPVLYFARQCFDCHGSGKIENPKVKSERLLVCPDCRGSGYSRRLSCYPSDAVLIQPVKTSEDQRWHDFVQANPDAYNAYMRHVACANCYLSDYGEKQFYHDEIGRDVRQMCAVDPNGALEHMKTLQSRYDAWAKGHPSMLRTNDDIITALRYNPIGSVDSSYKIECKITSSRLVKKTSDGSPLTLLIMSDIKTGAGYKTFIKGTPNDFNSTDTFKVSKAYMAGFDNKFNNGKPVVMLRNCKFIVED